VHLALALGSYGYEYAKYERDQTMLYRFVPIAYTEGPQYMKFWHQEKFSRVRFVLIVFSLAVQTHPNSTKPPNTHPAPSQTPRRTKIHKLSEHSLSSTSNAPTLLFTLPVPTEAK
jgi:hypothetical protein